jgi:hypothetical protein
VHWHWQQRRGGERESDKGICGTAAASHCRSHLCASRTVPSRGSAGAARSALPCNKHACMDARAPAHPSINPPLGLPGPSRCLLPAACTLCFHFFCACIACTGCVQQAPGLWVGAVSPCGPPMVLLLARWCIMRPGTSCSRWDLMAARTGPTDR